MSRRWFSVFAVLLLACALPPELSAQARIVVSATVKNARGEGISGAIIHSTAAGIDTTIRTDIDGDAALQLPSGAAHLQIKALGYLPLDRDVTITGGLKIELVMTAAAQQLEQRTIRDKWIGIRGVVGDNVTQQPISGAVITSARRKVHVVTDSAGHFEIPFERAEATVFQVEHPGHKTLISGIGMHDGANDVVLLMTPGNDANYLKNALDDLRRRQTVSPVGVFTAARAQLASDGAKNLYDGLLSSGLLQKSGLKLSESLCIFVDGLPRPGFRISTIPLASVEFIEIYGTKADVTQTLFTEWPRYTPCTYDATLPAQPKSTMRNSSDNYVKYVVVWTRK